jgi:hypothetical protein
MYRSVLVRSGARGTPIVPAFERPHATVPLNAPLVQGRRIARVAGHAAAISSNPGTLGMQPRLFLYNCCLMWGKPKR